VEIDEKTFFREATLRICGSLEIETALWNCFIYIKDNIPAIRMSLNLLDINLGLVETIARASFEKSELLSLKTPISPETHKRMVKKWPLARVRIFSPMRDYPLTLENTLQSDMLDCHCVILDLWLEGMFIGMLSVVFAPENKPEPHHIELLSLLNEPFAIALSNSIRYRKLQQYQDILAAEKQDLREELRRLSNEEIIGADFGLKQVMYMVRQVATLDSPVLLLGETGSGKEVIAGAIHHMSSRSDGPFIRVNSGAIPDTLIDSELFGHEKGAFTGALSRRRGHFERAHGGTIFLDEIGELPLEAQVRILRVLQEKEIERIGGTETIRVNIRVIAATHRNLDSMIEEGTFREDLYFRLKVFPIVIPPLRERITDIPALVQHFIQKKVAEMKIEAVPTLVPGEIHRLMDYHWPGNVRELENAVERALIINRSAPLSFPDIGMQKTTTPPPLRDMDDAASLNLDEAMARHIKKALNIARGKVEGSEGAAELLGINPRTLRHRMRKLGVAFGRNSGKEQNKR
jgi:transcriptional regulator with GAF, ATPase, and Fis domain